MKTFEIKVIQDGRETINFLVEYPSLNDAVYFCNDFRIESKLFIDKFFIRRIHEKKNN